MKDAYWADFFKLYDANKDGKISRKEWVSIQIENFKIVLDKDFIESAAKLLLEARAIVIKPEEKEAKTVPAKADGANEIKITFKTMSGAFTFAFDPSLTPMQIANAENGDRPKPLESGSSMDSMLAPGGACAIHGSDGGIAGRLLHGGKVIRKTAEKSMATTMTKHVTRVSQATFSACCTPLLLACFFSLNRLIMCL
jgi:hypothetical protein